MKLQRSTMILVATALVMGGVVLFTQARQSDPTRSTTGQSNAAATPVFEFEEADVVGLSIETQDQTVVFERGEGGFWQMTQPQQQPAEEAAIAFLLSRLTTDGLVQTTTIDVSDPAEFGLDAPFATVDLTLADETTHQLVLGAADFSGRHYYALIDPETLPLSETSGDIDAAIVTENIRNGVDRPLEDWQAVIDEAPAAEDDDNTDPEAAASPDDAASDDDVEADSEAAPADDGEASEEPDDAIESDDVSPPDEPDDS
ncbi:MAG: DUF4340 domain-containing protein [Cyanobacteria bacterium P01_E01_bin.43]